MSDQAQRLQDSSRLQDAWRFSGQNTGDSWSDAESSGKKKLFESGRGLWRRAYNSDAAGKANSPVMDASGRSEPTVASNKQSRILNAALERMFHKRRPKRRSSLPSDTPAQFRGQAMKASADEATRVSHFATIRRKRATFLKGRRKETESNLSPTTYAADVSTSDRTAEFTVGDVTPGAASDASSELEMSGALPPHAHKLYFSQVYVDHLRNSTMEERHRTINRKGRPLRRSRSETCLPKIYGIPQEVIGQGTCSVVRVSHKLGKGKHGREQLFAVKEFNSRHEFETERNYIKRLIGEFCISSTLDHINIIRTLDLIEDEQHKWYEIAEYCPGGDLYVLLNHGPLPPAEADCFFKQLANGVAYLHDMGVAHRDIKPENLLLDATGCLKITDFGNSEVFRTAWEKEAHMSQVACGDSAYMSPEEFLQESIDPRKTDVWAMGVVYLAMIHNSLPWRSATVDDRSYMQYVDAYNRLAKVNVEDATKGEGNIPVAPLADGGHLKAGTTPMISSVSIPNGASAAPGIRPREAPLQTRPTSLLEVLSPGIRPSETPLPKSPTSLLEVLSLGTPVSGESSLSLAPLISDNACTVSTLPRVVKAPGFFPADQLDDLSKRFRPAQLPPSVSYGPGYALIASLPAHKSAVILAILNPDPSTRSDVHDVLVSPWLVEIRECHVPGESRGSGSTRNGAVAMDAVGHELDGRRESRDLMTWSLHGT